MLIQTPLPSSIEAAFSIVSDHQKQDFVCEEHPKNGCGKAVPDMDPKKNDDQSCLLNFPSCSQLSTISTMSENSVPTLVYRRRKLQRNTKRSYDSISAISSEAPSTAAMEENIVSLVELENEAVRASVMHPLECSSGTLGEKSGFIDRCSAGKEPCSEDARESGTQKILDLGYVNDSCSSSKSNVEHGSASMKTEVDDTGECSSSEGLLDDLSEKDFCISILRTEGLLEGARSIRTHASDESKGTCSGRICSLSCKVCGQSETTLEMLICDHCEEAFHVSCCNPRIRKIPADEWFCHSCLKKTRKILKETSISEMGRCSNETFRGELGPVAFMLSDTEPYITGVRIGRDFQADVPDWSGPIINDVDIVGKPLETTPTECVSLHRFNSSKSSRLSSIGNWLQCREVIDGVGDDVDGTICGKWRRAPLFEVQTDDWECFRSVLWDPAHADCAVPQELDTNEILKHLKYIEMLRPRLDAKRRRLDSAKSVGSQDLTENVSNIQTQ